MGAEQSAECGHAAESHVQACFGYRRTAVQERAGAVQPERGEVRMGRLTKGLHECAVQVVAGKASLPRNIFERDPFAHLPMEKLPRDLEPAEQLFLRRT